MRPRVFVDCRWVGETGLGRYVDQMMNELTQLDHGLTVVAGVLASQTERPDWLGTSGVEMLEIESRWFTPGEQIELPRVLGEANVDLAHFTNFNVPLRYRRPVVTTVHDLTLMDHPTAGPAAFERVRFTAKSVAMRIVLRRALRRSRFVLTPSEFVAGEISDRCGVPREKLVVTPEAPSSFPPSDRGAVSELGVRSPFVLSVGNAYPHKNLDRLLDAFELLNVSTYPASLLLVGPDDSHRALLRKAVARRGLDERVVVLGRVSDAELGVLLRAADAYVFPSLSEGFGLPGLEAMAAGTPVVSSSATCLPEVFGNAAVYFDPSDASDMAAALQRVASERALRDRMIATGLARAATFTWRRTAEQTLKVYRRALSDR